MERRGRAKVLIVGGGVAALEAALALDALAAEHVDVELVAPERSFAYRPLLVAEPFAFRDGALAVAPAGTVAADRVVALPRLEGPRLEGVLHDPNGFIPTDEHGQVSDEIDVWAAGDATRFPLKQGGIAAQQADAAAEAIAARAGAALEPRPFRPVLRGLLLTGMVPRFLRAEAGTAVSTVDTEPLWWPPAKIVGRHLAPFLAKHLGLSEEPPNAARETAVRVEVELSPTGHGAWSEL
jgi:NADH dehydrogenase FAD-containing subunit